MTATDTQSDSVRKILEVALRESLSPDGVAAAICFLRTAEFGNRPTHQRVIAALREVEWMADLLTNMLGVEEHNRLMEELGL